MKQKISVVKVGGAVVEDNEQIEMLLKDFAAISGKKILIHGGGRSATKIAASLGIESRMANGRRITDKAMLDVVIMVYGGLINKNIVALLQAQGVNALGLSGADMNLIRSHKRPLKDGIDLISCPTCSRTKIDLINIVEQAEKELKHVKKNLKIAIRGCPVNGPGEAKEADLGIAGGNGKGLIFKKGQIIKKVEEKDLLAELINEINKLEE